MDFGASCFMTDYSMPIVALAQAWRRVASVAAGRPSIRISPLSRKIALPGRRRRAEECITTRWTRSCPDRRGGRDQKAQGRHRRLPVIQRDTIQTGEARRLARPGIGRPLPVRHWRRLEPGRDGGSRHDFATRFKRMREQVEAMREIWTKSKPEYHGDIVDFPPMMAWPKPVQNPLPIIVGGAFPHAARRAVRYGNGWITDRRPADLRRQFERVISRNTKQMLAEAGRSLADAPISMFGAGGRLRSADALQANWGWRGSSPRCRRRAPTRSCRGSTLGCS